MPVYKDEKRKTYYCSFYYTDMSGNRKRKKKEGFKTKREAADYERWFISNSQRTPEMTFMKAYELYKDDYSARLKPTTVLTKTNMIDNLIVPYFSDMALKDIDAGVVRLWQNDFLKKKYTPSYTKTVYNQLNALMRFATDFLKLPENPCKKAGSIGSLRITKDMKFWTVDEFYRVYDEIEDYPMQVAIYTLYWTGMRIGELLALTIADIKGNTIRINKAYNRVNKQDVIGTPKSNNSVRDVLVHDGLADMLKTYIALMPSQMPQDRIFPYSKYDISSTMKESCAKAEVHIIRIHDLRHSHVSMLINQGVAPVAIAERIGDSVQVVLDTYSHLYPSTKKEVVDRISTIAVR